MKTFRFLTVLALSMLVLTSCEFILPGFSSTSSSTASEGGYYTPTSFSTELSDLKDELGYVNMASTGTQHLLVIPVDFTDYGCDALTHGCTTTHTDIENTFFGDAADTGWESLASFYHQSSYGHLTLEGTVTPWYHLGKTTAYVAGLSQYTDPTYYVLRNAIEWYRSESGSSLSEYDQNGDGYIDGVWLIYAAPDYSKVLNPSNAYQNLYWAYTFWDYDYNENPGSVSAPTANVYGWASYDFMYEGYGTGSVDAHTYIHETGHMMGLDDYYSYDTNDWGAAGGVDMMDYNIADHDAYSKMLLGWTMPYVVDGSADSATLSLDPFESSGDCVLVRQNWNGSPLDEYLLLEFYTPTGLNEADSQIGGYPGNNARAFSIPGIKIYHIDSRMGKFNISDYSFTGQFTDSVVLTNTVYTDFAVSNTASYSYADADFKLIHLLEASGVNTLKEGYMAGNSALFTAGKTFSPSSFSTFFANAGKFDDNSAIGFSIHVNSVTSSAASVTITTL